MSLEVEMGKKCLGDYAQCSWWDIVTHEGWVRTLNEKPSKCETVGWLTACEEDYITISATRSEGADGMEYNQHITIPRGCIIQLEL